MATRHDPISPNTEFCSTPGDPCKCSNPNYYKRDCNPGWIDSKGKHKHQAHHVVAISCVNWLPKTQKKKEGLLRVLAKTIWCVNHQNNVMPLPVMMGTTAKYYLKHGNAPKEEISPPLFKDLPQHDRDHNTSKGYCTEVKKRVSQIYDDVSEAGQNHEGAAATLKAQLEALSAEFKATLKARGIRDGGSGEPGTHAAWFHGMENPDSNWFLPFSMASKGNADKIRFPSSRINWAMKLQDLISLFRKSPKK